MHTREGNVRKRRRRQTKNMHREFEFVKKNNKYIGYADYMVDRSHIFKLIESSQTNKFVDFIQIHNF